MADDFDVLDCRGCGKEVYPSERLNALKSVWHRGCLKCTTCQIVLNSKTLESFQNTPYCRSHLVHAKTGGGTQTSHAGATGVTSAPVTHGSRSDPQAEILKAKANYKPPAQTSGANYRRPNPADEIAAARAKGGVAPETPVGTNYRRPNPADEIAAARAKGGAAPETPVGSNYRRPNPADEIAAARARNSAAPDTPVGSNYRRPNPAEEIAAARAKGGYEPEENKTEYRSVKTEEIRGGKVTDFASKFNTAAAAPTQTERIAPTRPPPRVGGSAAPSAPPPVVPPKPAYHQPEPAAQDEWEEPAAEQHYDQGGYDQSYDQQGAYEEPQHQEEYDQSGYDQGGYDQQGGYEEQQQQEYDQSGYDQQQQEYDQSGGYDQQQQEYDQSGYDQQQQAEGEWVDDQAQQQQEYYDDQGQQAVGYATALYDFAGEVEGDLSFSAGEVITITNWDSDWWVGYTESGATGQFPSTYVQVSQ